MVKLKKKKVAGLYLRPDGVYEKILKIDGKRVAFRSTKPEEVWQKMAAYEQRQEEGPLFEEVAVNWWNEHTPTLTHNTVLGYRAGYKRVKDAFGTIPIKEITASMLGNYIKGFSLTRSYKTVSNEVLILRLIFNFAGAKDLVSANPASFVKIPKGLPKNPRTMPTDKEINTVKSSVKKEFGLFFYLVLYTGCRKGEALALKWKDIDFKGRLIHINKSIYFDGVTPEVKFPKTENGNRDVVLLDKLYDVLLPIRGIPEDNLFVNKKGRPLSKNEYSSQVEKYGKSVGISITAHRLRHAYATMLYETGMDDKLIQYFVGHAQLSTTMDTYAKLRMKRMLKTAKGLEKTDIDTDET